MKKVMFFDFGFGGHIMEWMNHLYNEAAIYPTTAFVFVFREDEFKAFSSQMEWGKHKNISIILMPDYDVGLANKGGAILKIINRNIILLKYLSRIKETLQKPPRYC